MAIKVQHISFSQNETVISSEDDAAKSLKEMIQTELSIYNNCKGNIYILSSIRIFGQKRDDIDILVIGLLDNLILKNLHTKNYGEVNELNINSFIVNIELKSHPANKVCREGTDYIVTYSNARHNASQQSREAKFSLLNHLTDQLDLHPFICDILWFNGLSMRDLTSMRGNSEDNTLPSGFSFRDLVSTILLQVNVKKNEANQFSLDSFNGNGDDFKKIVDLFTAKREPKGLTKAKFELLSQQSTEVDKLLQNTGNKLTIVTGRAGTGKTIQLLQLAFRLANADTSIRCLLLTYNNALVSDIKRLIDYTPMPSRVDGRTVAIKTIDSFFQTLMRETGVLNTKLIPTNSNYREQYNGKLEELYKYVIEECNKEDIDTLKDIADQYIDWDYILIDEAQDFTDLEKKILFKVYGPHRLIVADGIDQFMRIGQRQLWAEGVNKDLLWKPRTMELERRQKSFLVTFVNAFAKLANIDWRVNPNDQLPGGEIKIYPNFTNKQYNELKANCERNGCENYDILILEPPSQVKREGDNRCFAKAKAYEKAGIPIFDGINNQLRTTYPTKDQCRVFQYDSCRGLEGWCVVCADFDQLIQYKLDTYQPDEDALGFDPEIIKKRSVYLWSLMPLTRPIDTLVITLKDPNSEVGKILKQLADIYPFVEWNIN